MDDRVKATEGAGRRLIRARTGDIINVRLHPKLSRQASEICT